MYKTRSPFYPEPCAPPLTNLQEIMCKNSTTLPLWSRSRDPNSSCFYLAISEVSEALGVLPMHVNPYYNVRHTPYMRCKHPKTHQFTTDENTIPKYKKLLLWWLQWTGGHILWFVVCPHIQPTRGYAQIPHFSAMWNRTVDIASPKHKNRFPRVRMTIQELRCVCNRCTQTTGSA